MNQFSDDERILGCRYALCVGIGVYTNLANYYDLRYAVDDASAIAAQLERNGDFLVTRLTTPVQTTKAALDQAVEHLLSAPERQSADLAVLYFSGHGSMEPEKDPKPGYEKDTFCLWSSDTTMQEKGVLNPATLIGISDLARWFSQARVHNIVLFLDVCHSGGAGVTLQRFELHLETGPNYFILGAARQDQVTEERSELEHGLFTTCLLRAFGQPPAKDGWLTISQIENFVSEEIQGFTKEQPISIQGASVFTNSPLLLLRNSGYPELYPLPPVWNVPPRNLFFTGQEYLLSQLANRLQSEQKTALTQPQAINGLGGIGKTQLALEYAYRHRQDYHAVLWGRADSHETLISTFVNIAYLLDLPQKGEKDQMVTVEAVKIWLMERSKWLLILDNADELAFVKEFIPPAFPGHLLLTTRAQAMGGLAHKLEVEVMPPEMGALLLLRRASLIAPSASLEQASPADVMVAKELSEEMGGLPLALDQAGAYIEEVSCSLQDYRRLYQVRRTELLKERGGVVLDHPESVATTWSLAFQKVEQSNPVASDLLRLSAFLHPDAIPKEIITKGAEHLSPQLQAMASDPLALDRAIKSLQAYSLLRRDRTSHDLIIHRLVQAVLKDAMDEQTRYDWALRAIQAVAATFPEPEFNNWSQCERCLPHVQACAGLIHTYEVVFPDAAQLLLRSGSYLVARALYIQAEQLLQQALAICEKALGLTHLDTAEGYDMLGWLYVLRGEYDKAAVLLPQGLTIREQALGSTHSSTAQSLSNLGYLYVEQRKFQEATFLLQRAVAIREQTLGPTHPSTAQSWHYLGWAYNEQGKYKEAEPPFQKSLSIREQVLGPAHPDTLDDLCGLGWLYSKQGRYKEAEALFQKALSIREELLGPNHPATAEAWDSLGWVYRCQGKHKEAERLLQQALASREQTLRPNHPDTARNLLFLALVYKDQGRYKEAEPLCQKARAIYEQVSGLGTLDMAKAWAISAQLLWKRGQIIKAALVYIRVLRTIGLRVMLRYAVETLMVSIRRMRWM